MSDFKAKMHQNSAGAPPRTPPGELITALPRLRSWIKWAQNLSGWEGRGGEGRRGECCGVQKILKIDP